MLTAGFQVELVDAPVLEVIPEREDTHLFDQMESSSSIEVQDGSECPRMPIEVELHVDQTVVVADIHDRLVGVAVTQLAQPGVGQTVEGPPHRLVLHPANVQHDPLRHRLALSNRVRIGFRTRVHAHVLRQHVDRVRIGRLAIVVEFRILRRRPVDHCRSQPRVGPVEVAGGPSTIDRSPGGAAPSEERDGPLHQRLGRSGVDVGQVGSLERVVTDGTLAAGHDRHGAFQDRILVLLGGERLEVVAVGRARHRDAPIDRVIAF